ncbi:hypothetical protein Scep_006892 [Stephania cephalantha]|uniref:Uncharacterized protein n=1 Tax=Stephania cephalantha TaxID=152367 RepID=A0AAP0PNC0_9MAGN
MANLSIGGHGKLAYGYYGENPKMNELTQRAMARLFMPLMNVILEIYDGLRVRCHSSNFNGGNDRSEVKGVAMEEKRQERDMEAWATAHCSSKPRHPDVTGGLLAGMLKSLDMLICNPIVGFRNRIIP